MRPTEWKNLCYTGGPNYVLGFQYPNEDGENSQNPGLQRAYEVLWGDLLQGPWEVPKNIGLTELRLSVLERQTSYLRRYGLLTLRNGEQIACHTCIVPEGLTDFLGVEIPPSCLGALFKVAYPTHSAANLVWRNRLDETLIALAEAVYQESPFELAVWGEEAGALGPEVENLSDADFERGGFILSPDCWNKTGRGRAGKQTPTGLWLFPERLSEGEALGTGE